MAGSQSFSLLLALCILVHNAVVHVNAQLSMIVNRGNFGSDLVMFNNILFSSTDSTVDNFEGTAFLPIDDAFTELSRSNPRLYRRIFENTAAEQEEFAQTVQTQILQHHLIPGSRRRSNEIVVGTEWQALSGEVVQATEVLPFTRTNLNSPFVVGHKIASVLLPSVWTRSVQDVLVGTTADGYVFDEDEVVTVYLPPAFESTCPAFVQAHVRTGRVEIGSAAGEVTDTVVANNGVVHRIAQPLPYTACDSQTTTGGETVVAQGGGGGGTIEQVGEGGTTEQVGGGDTIVGVSTTEPNGGGTTNGGTTTGQVDSGGGGTAEQVDGGDTANPIENETQSPTGAPQPVEANPTPTTDGSTTTPENTAGEESSTNTSTTTQESNIFRDFLPLILAVSIGACIALVCFVGCMLVSRNYYRSDGDMKKPTHDEDAMIPSHVYEDSTYQDDGMGITLDPDIQEPSFLTLPTFAYQPDDNHDKANNNSDTQ